jgi:spermidine synthase
MPPFAAGLIVFAASAAVLVLEILAARLLAPYVGVTLETYTGIIGTVLAGISVGAWYGGKLADRVDPRKLLGPMVILGGVLALATAPTVTLLGVAIAGTGARGPVSIVLLAFAGFFAPAALLSAVSPTVVKLQLASLDETGRVVGWLSAIGTAGAIFGTFFTGFVLVAALPTRPIILGVGGLLIVGGLGLWAWLGRERKDSPVPLLLLGLVAAALTMGVSGPCDVETTYYCARVVIDEERPTGRLLVLDTLRHSYVDLADPTYLDFGYTRMFSDVLTTAAPPGEPIDALHIGGGAFTMPRYLAATRPGSNSLVLELDAVLVDLAKAEFGLKPGPRLRVAVGDARLGVRQQPPASYDVVIGDAFGGLAVPWHLTTREFTEQIRGRLRAGGIYMINVIDNPPLDFVRAEAATLAAVFDHVAVLAPAGRLQGAEGGNFVLVGSDGPLDVDGMLRAIERRGGDETLLVGTDYAEFARGSGVLTDEHAPVDQLLTPRA